MLHAYPQSLRSNAPSFYLTHPLFFPLFVVFSFTFSCFPFPFLPDEKLAREFGSMVTDASGDEEEEGTLLESLDEAEEAEEAEAAASPVQEEVGLNSLS